MPFTSPLVRRSLSLALTIGLLSGAGMAGAHAGALAGGADAPLPEFNPVHRRPLPLGPETNRLIIGFRATPANTVLHAMVGRGRVHSVNLAQAETTRDDVAGLAKRSSLVVAASRQLTPSAHVMFLRDTLYGADVETALARLRADPAVEFADVDQRRFISAAAGALPNDPLFVATASATGQWYLLKPSATGDVAAVDAVSAWGITTGSTETVIADVDTGVVYTHPDLLKVADGGRLLPGYDFIGQDLSVTDGHALGTFLIANDNDGRDADASDPGDWVNAADETTAQFPASQCGAPETSSWHGTRVVGIFGAWTNNGVGIAGLTWGPKVLPVRALGKCGGYDSDIIAGMQWAAGLTVTGVPANPNPVDIINLSLGGSGTCPSSYASVVKTLSTMGVLVVASAGNASGPVEAPANCAGVLAVAGLRNIGTKVGYSSLGAEVSLGAPAGNCVTTSGPCLKSIDTTTNLGLTVPGDNAYTDKTNYNLGTSFSAPIVSGVAALMLAVNPGLTPAELITRIKTSATPYPQPAGVPICPALATDGSGECACPNDGTQCGAGMVNALSAVTEAQRPIAVLAAPSSTPGVVGEVVDGSASVASQGRTIAAYQWTASGGATLASGQGTAAVTVVPGTTSGTLALTVTDNLGATDAASVAVPIALTVSQTLAPGSVQQNGVATLTITLTNLNAADESGVTFTDTLPANITFKSTPAPVTTCAGTFSVSGTSATLTGGTLPAFGVSGVNSCTITVPVASATVGTYTNTIAANALLAAGAIGNTAPTSTTLTVTAAPKSGGGAIDWWDMMFVTGLLLAGRRKMGPRPPR